MPIISFWQRHPHHFSINSVSNRRHSLQIIFLSENFISPTIYLWFHNPLGLHFFLKYKSNSVYPFIFKPVKHVLPIIIPITTYTLHSYHHFSSEECVYFYRFCIRNDLHNTFHSPFYSPYHLHICVTKNKKCVAYYTTYSPSLVILHSLNHSELYFK